MTGNRFLYRRAREAAAMRRHLLGEEPSSALRQILNSPDRNSLYRSIFLLYYVYFIGATFRLKLFISELADRDTPASRRRVLRLKKALIEELSVSCRISEAFLEREYFSRDVAVVPRFILKWLYRFTPLLVVQPDQLEDLKKVIGYSRIHNIPITVRAASSSVFGAVIPTSNGVVLDLSRLNKVVNFDPMRRIITVEAGMRWSELNSFLEPYSLCFAVSPSSRFSTVGGWLATGGLGINSYKFGSVANQVVAVNILHPNGVESAIDNPEKLVSFLGSEGQFGVFTHITLALRDLPDYSAAVLLSFPRLSSTFDFLNRFPSLDIPTTHLVLFDRNRMVEENRLFVDRTGRSEQIVPERDALLFHFDEQGARNKLLEFIRAKGEEVQVESELAARYLWEERFFPLKAQRIGPNLLAVELLIPDLKLVDRINQKLGRLVTRFGIEASLEIIAIKHGDQIGGVQILSFPTDAKHRLAYLLQLLFVQLAVLSAIRLGALPYGFGIWNAPFFKQVMAVRRRQELVRLKKELDPAGLINRGKFFSVQGRFYGFSSLLFQHAIFLPSLHLLLLFSPLLGLLLRLIKPRPNHRWSVPAADDNNGRTLLAEAVQRCTFCGACVSVCPAYQLTRDELTTGRGKLFLADRLLRGRESRAAEHFRSFQCLHCHLCEEVCQTRLPLVSCYEKLEDLTVSRFGTFPKELVKSFVEMVDRKRDWLVSTFGLNLAQWTPSEMSGQLPKARQSLVLDDSIMDKMAKRSVVSGGDE